MLPPALSHHDLFLLPYGSLFSQILTFKKLMDILWCLFRSYKPFTLSRDSWSSHEAPELTASPRCDSPCFFSCLCSSVACLDCCAADTKTGMFFSFSLFVSSAKWCPSGYSLIFSKFIVSLDFVHQLFQE